MSSGEQRQQQHDRHQYEQQQDDDDDDHHHPTGSLDQEARLERKRLEIRALFLEYCDANDMSEEMSAVTVGIQELGEIAHRVGSTHGAHTFPLLSSGGVRATTNNGARIEQTQRGETLSAC